MLPGVLGLLSGWSKWKLALRALLWPHGGEGLPVCVWRLDAGPRSYTTSPHTAACQWKLLEEKVRKEGRAWRAAGEVGSVWLGPTVPLARAGAQS